MSKNNFGLSSFSPSPRTALGPACIAADGPNASVAPLQFLTALSAQGDVVPYDTPYGHAYLINHPDHIRRVFQSGNYLRGSLIKIVLGEGLLASEGVYWRQQRHLMQPAFHPQSVARLDAIMTRASAEMLGRWQKFARSGQPIDVQTETGDREGSGKFSLGHLYAGTDGEGRRHLTLSAAQRRGGKNGSTQPHARSK